MIYLVTLASSALAGFHEGRVCICLRTASCQYFLPSVCFLHEVFSDCSAILTKNIAGSSGIELPILFASIESIDTFVSIDDFDTFSIVSPITKARRTRELLAELTASRGS